MQETDPPAARLRSTLLWAAGTALALFAAVTVLGVLFLIDYENKLAKSIFEEHRATILSVYARIGAGYLVAGLLR